MRAVFKLMTLSNIIFNRFRRNLLKVLAVVAMVLLINPVANGAPFNEYQVKAVFIFNLTHFVTWPAETFKTPEAPFVVGIVGIDPFSGVLDHVLQGETYNSRPIIIKRFSSAKDLTENPCHLLFVAANALTDWLNIHRAIQDKPILTVAEEQTFCRQSGMVCLLNEGGRIKVEINLSEAKRSKFEISSKLLNVAAISNN
jgi:hypothetical protein